MVDDIKRWVIVGLLVLMVFDVVRSIILSATLDAVIAALIVVLMFGKKNPFSTEPQKST